MSENRPVNKFEQWAADERGWRRKARMEDRAHAFEEGVDATLEMLRPLLVTAPRTSNGLCTGCHYPIAGLVHAYNCPWPKIDDILGAGHDS